MPCVTVVSKHGQAIPLGRSHAKAVALDVLGVLGMDDAELELTLVGDGEMARLHWGAMGRTGPTNAIALSEEDFEHPERVGEVVLCTDALIRECDLYGQDHHEHLVRLLAHAFLHLAGLDHGPEMDALTESAVDALAPMPEVF